jgi:hypothetical protein
MMNSHRLTLLAGVILAMTGVSVSFAEDPHGQEAIRHLDKAAESGKQGSAAEAGKHTDEAKQHVIEGNTEHPYRKSPKKISGENPKQEHDEQTFGEMQRPKGHAKQGHAQEAGESAAKAESHLKQKEQAK